VNPGRRLTLGVIGHVDHGKTALTRALTGMDTDRLPEERRRGISIALGFAHCVVDGADIDMIDMPGHERFVRTMISGATGVDAVLLVVAANEGLMPQTREHVDIAGLLGVRRALIVVSKADLATPERCAEVGVEAAALAGAAGMKVAGPLRFSALSGSGLLEVRAAISVLAAQAETPEDAGFAWLPIDRAFTVAGHGTVVTGTLRRGVLRTRDEIELAPEGRPLRIRGLQAHGRRVEEATPGQRVAVNLRGVEPGEVSRGLALAAAGALAPSSWLDIWVKAVEGAPALATGAGLALLFGSTEVEARLRLLDRDELAPGERALAQLKTTEPVSVPAREPFVLRLRSPAVTVAGGVVLDPESRRQRRSAPGVLRRLENLAGATPEAIVGGELAGAGEKGVNVARLARLAGLAPARVAALLRGQVPPPVFCDRDRFAVAGPAFDALLARLPQVLSGHPSGLGADALAGFLPQASAPALAAAVARLAAADKLRQAGGRISLADSVRENAEAVRRRLEAVRLAEALKQAGLTPPEPWKLAPDPGRRQSLERLVRDGVAVRAQDRMQQREVIFHRDAVAEAQRRLASLLNGDGLLVSEIGAALGISRKYSVPLLEHLDSINFTRRIADRRVLAR
jgi:selenocysteine-specific elongation factor